MTQTMTTKEGLYMKELNATWRGTDEHLLITDRVILSQQPRNFSVTNWYFEKVNLTVDPENGAMHHPLIQHNNKCTYESLYCFSNTGTMVWNIIFQRSEPTACTTQQQRSEHCWINEDALICPELSIIMFDDTLEYDHKCGYRLGHGRALWSQKDTETRPINQPDFSDTLTLRMDYKSLYDQILEQRNSPAYIKLIHIGVCNAYPQNMTITSI